MKDNCSIEKNKIKGPCSVLVVEDDDIFRELIIKIVNKAGCSVESVSRGVEAIDYVTKNPTTLILLDFYLLDMTGKKVIETLHARLGKVLFVMMTGFGDEKLAVEMMKLGARDYLVKDANFIELLEAVVKKVINQIAIERKLAVAEKAVIESEEKYRSLFEYASDSIFIIDPGTRCFLDINQNAAKSLGYTRDELLSMRLDDLYFPETMPCMESVIQELNIKGSILYEDIHKKKDGSEMHVEISSRLLEYHGEAIIQSFIRDVTGRKKAEKKEKLQNQQLVQADKMKSLGILVAGIGHEINNPNNFIMFNTPILSGIWKDIIPILEEYKEKNDKFALGGLPYEEVRDAVPKLFAGIIEGSRRIKSICKNLKNFSRQSPSHRQSLVDINKAVKTSVDLMRHLIKKSTLNFSVNLFRNIPPIKGNFQEIEQVIINLITNACQALTNNNEKIVIQTSLDEEHNNVIVEVVDEGKGISQENLPKVTNPFFTTKREQGGTGLGLSVSFRIIRDHMGELSFSSEPGKTTKVTLKFPVVNRRK